MSTKTLKAREMSKLICQKLINEFDISGSQSLVCGVVIDLEKTLSLFGILLFRLMSKTQYLSTAANCTSLCQLSCHQGDSLNDDPQS